MRSKLTGFKIDIAGERNPTPPQYYKSIEMVLHMTGENITPKQVEKAIALSQDKYCSVYHSLRKDLKVTVKYFISEGLNPGKS
jgi:putative redox protein